jgi:hypothetical protein
LTPQSPSLPGWQTSLEIIQENLENNFIVTFNLKLRFATFQIKVLSCLNCKRFL